MKNCTICNAIMDDDALFCTSCGNKFGENASVEPEVANPAPQQAPAQDAYVPPVNPGAPAYTSVPPTYQNYQPYSDPADHTSEFTAEDISAHKVYALLVYLGGIVGIIPALLIGKDSPYLKFHVQQKMKLMVSQMLVVLIASITSFLILPLLAASIVALIIAILNIICFFKTAQGKSVEPAIIKDIKLFK